MFDKKSTPQNFIKGGFKSEGRGGFSQLPKTSAEKLSWDLENENSDTFLRLQV